MKGLTFFALTALLPAGLYAPQASATITLALCGGDGQVRTVQVPLEEPGRGPEPCCVKGCHAVSSRKKAARNFEPPQ
jgi:hypothetical protein